MVMGEHNETSLATLIYSVLTVEEKNKAAHMIVSSGDGMKSHLTDRSGDCGIEGLTIEQVFRRGSPIRLSNRKNRVLISKMESLSRLLL